ncbi:MAG: tetratricopeptide repeat protein [Candidatus Methylomirabilia bacterium]
MLLARTISWTLLLIAVVTPLRADAFRYVSVGDPAPLLTLEDLQGRSVKVPQPGRVTVVIFWRPGQRFSEEALKGLAGLKEAMEPRGVEMMAVAEAGSNPHESRILAKRLSLRFLLDPQSRAAQAYGIIVYPSTAVVGPGGRLRYYLPSRNVNYRTLIEGHLLRALGEISEKELAERLSRAGEVYGQTAEAAQAEYQRGVRLARQKRYDDAAVALAKVVSVRPGFLEAHLQLGYALLELGEPAQALQEFEFVLRKNPVSPGARVGRGIAHLRLGRTDEGIRLLQEAVVLNPEPVRGHYELGRAYEAKGEWSRAIEQYRWAYRKLLQGRK